MIEDELARIVGAGNVSREEKVLKEYSRDMSFVSTIMPKYVVKPNNTGDIQEIVNIARETQTPLVPISSSPPHFRGDTVPATEGALIVDLSDMKKIIRVDRLNRVVMFEPGVTFKNLRKAVASEGLRLNMPLLPRASKSVIGSMLEREPVQMPCYHWDIADPLACVEVIFGTGDMFRTGAAAGPGELANQWAAGGAQKEAAGPSSASWYRLIQGAQGSMGIVTWATARCELLPRIEEAYLVGSDRIDKILEMVHWLLRLRLVNECFVLNNINLAQIMTRKWPDDYQYIREVATPWVLFFNIAGYDYLPEERVRSHTEDMYKIARRVGLDTSLTVGGVSASDVLSVTQHPSEEPYWKLRYKGSCEDIFFLTDHEDLPDLVTTMYDVANESGCPSSDIGVYIQPIVQGVNLHCEFNLFYDQQDPIEANRVRTLATTATRKLMDEGAFFSRPYGENAGIIIDRDAETVDALKKVKEIVDPHNVMNPGKLCF